VVIWYIFPILVCLDQEKSGNHAETTDWEPWGSSGRVLRTWGPDEFVKNGPKVLSKQFFTKNNTFLGKKVRKNVVYFCNFQKMPKVNNRPLGENSPNLVTLAAIFFG
jgi:hypothetical protein